MSDYLIKSGALFEDFEVLNDWTIANGTGSIDPILVKIGSGSLKLTSNSGATCTAIKTISSSFTQKSNLEYWVYITDITKVTSVAVYFSSTTDFSKSYSNTFSQGVLHNGWNAIPIDWGGWTNNNAESWSNTMIRMKVQVISQSSQIAIVYFDSMYLDRYHRPAIVFTFDDNRLSQRTIAFDILNKYGFNATAYINTGTINGSGDGYTCMSTEQVQDLFDSGWDISNHTYDHSDLATLTYSQMYNEIYDNQTNIINSGWSRRNSERHFCYPFGSYNDTTIQVLTDLNVLTSIKSQGRTQSFYLDNKYNLVRNNMGMSTTLASMISEVKSATYKGDICMFAFHDIVTTAPGTEQEWQNTDFDSLLNYIYLHKRSIDILTITELYGRFSGVERIYI